MGWVCGSARVWTTDAFYRETADMVTYRKEEGCTAVDMECAAMGRVREVPRRALWANPLYGRFPG